METLFIPYEPFIFGVKVNVHLTLEYLAFAIAFRYYIFLRRNTSDHISNSNRLSIILGATIGALAGSRLIGFLENPAILIADSGIAGILETKSIMGGLFGGLIGVEVAKKVIHEHRSSGDLFVFPIIVGIFIGRIGCFLMGVKEFTYGIPTNFISGMDLGDGIKRHPTSLYEIFYLLIVFAALKSVQKSLTEESGKLFKVFMILYFGFRFFIEFLKPNTFFILGLSSIQWLCVACWLYYFHTIKLLLKNAYKNVHIL